MLSHADKTIFVHIPKTGGQSVETAFLKRHGLSWPERAPLLLRPRAPDESGPDRLAHLYAREYVELGFVEQALFDRYFKFTVVRNPWARAVSEYKYERKIAGPSFEHFIVAALREGKPLANDRHIVPQVTYLRGKDGSVLVDRIIRFERLGEAFAEVTTELFGAPLPLPRRNVAKNRTDYRAYYNETTRTIVEEYYREDIAAFGYTFDDG